VPERPRLAEQVFLACGRSSTQLMRDSLGSMHDDLDVTDTPSFRRRRLALRLAVGAIWSFGVLLAVRSGWEPGYWWGARVWPYPFGHVSIVIVQVTLVSFGLYDLLRPKLEGSSIARTARAALAAFATLVSIAMNTWTDQPGYAYAAGRYVLIVTALLVLVLVAQAAVAAIDGLRRRKHAA